MKQYQNAQRKSKHKWDIILVAGIVFFGAVIALVVLLTRESGASVAVRVDGKVIETFDLDQELRYEITGYSGGTNTLVISGGQVWLEDADCPDKLCVNMGKISSNGQSIVCLPHRVVIEISAEASEDDVDLYVK